MSVSDRAQRYRANQTVEGPKVCLFCGSTRDLGVEHLDGFEEHNEPENLCWLCRSCNQLKSAVFKKAGLGRRTVQYNPGIFQSLFGPKETYRVHGAAHPEARRERAAERRETREREADERRTAAEDKKMRAQYEARVKKDAREAERAAAPKTVGRYKGFTIYKAGSPGDRHFYSTMDPDSWLDTEGAAKRLIDTFKNPASSLSAWRGAVGVLRGESPGSPFKAARVVRSTPVSRRYRYLDQMMRENPKVPTFEQYAFAVSTHTGRSYIPGHGWTEGAHDEGGAVIHATPKAKRREYADRIADMKARRGHAADSARWD